MGGMNWKSYERARDLNGALALLAQAGGRGRIIAGGTDLVLQLHQKEQQTDLLVDVTRIQELQRLCEEDGHIRIGAVVTHSAAAESPLLRREAAALAAGCGMVGSPQIRNIATLMGNVITAQPAADAAVPLTALEAELRVLSPMGERWVHMEAAYRGVGESAIDATREVAAADPLPQTRGGRADPLLPAGPTGRPGPAGSQRCRLSVGGQEGQADPRGPYRPGPVAAQPFRARQAEACLISDRITEALLEEAARCCHGGDPTDEPDPGQRGISAGNDPPLSDEDAPGDAGYRLRPRGGLGRTAGDNRENGKVQTWFKASRFV